MDLDEKYNIFYQDINDVFNLDVQAWKYQRTLNYDRIKELKESFMYNYNSKGDLSIRMPIILCKLQNKYYIVDGQHRFYALKDLKVENKLSSVWIYVGVINCQTEDDIRFEFNNINNVTKMEICYIETSDIINEAMNKLMLKFPNIISFDKNYQRPKFNVDIIKSGLIDNSVIEKLNITTSDQLVICFEKLQEYYLANNINFFANKIRVKYFDKTLNNIYNKLKNNHRIGLFKREHIQHIIDDLITINS